MVMRLYERFSRNCQKRMFVLAMCAFFLTRPSHVYKNNIRGSVHRLGPPSFRHQWCCEVLAWDSISQYARIQNLAFKLPLNTSKANLEA